MKKKSIAIFIFRREHRLFDNTGLIEASFLADIIVPVFIFTPEQTSHKNSYKSNNAIQFMLESLKDLNTQIKHHSNNKSSINFFYGKQHEVIKELLGYLTCDYSFVYVCANKDYTKYATIRDSEIEKVCDSFPNALFQSFEDYLLHPIGSIKTSSGSIYQKYTPYANAASLVDVRMPQKFTGVFHTSKISSSASDDLITLPVYNAHIAQHGGRTNALLHLKHVKKIMKEYSDRRNDLNRETTQMSAYIKFGCISIREVYYEFVKHSDTLVKQLIWRDFYYNIGYGYPWIYEGKSLKEKYDNIIWNESDKWLKAWKAGLTGFPIVDAGMTELNATGFMHNRSRLITSNFLTKTLGIDWRHGEKYFAQKLYDVDHSVNNGNWQWIAGCGADSQPYFRILNPWLQSKKFDPDAEYIKKWLPHLQKFTSEQIHNWDIHGDPEIHPLPIVDFRAQRDIVLAMYKKLV